MATCNTTGCKDKPWQNETLHVKCKRAAANYEEINYENVIINEVLWYADHNGHSVSKDGILKVLSCHCSMDDVNTAEALLVSQFGDHVNPDLKKNRKDSHKRMEQMKVCEDILDALFDIDEHIDITCVSLNWRKTI